MWNGPIDVVQTGENEKLYQGSFSPSFYWQVYYFKSIKKFSASDTSSNSNKN